MEKKNQVLAGGLSVLVGVSLLASCATLPKLSIHYQLPPPTAQLKGKRIYLHVEDARADKNILGRGARKEFGSFSGEVTLSVARHGETGFKIGTFKVGDMMKEGFTRRLQNLGVEVLSEPLGGEPQLYLVLNVFKLDLMDREWKGEMDFQARLVKDGRVLTKQTFNGSAERYKVVGRGAADTVMGELFTEMANKLDVAKLFRQGNLL